MSNVQTKVTENETKDLIASFHCNECKRSTRHRVFVSLDKSSFEKNDREGWCVEWSDRYQVLECQGCETISFRHVNWCSEAIDFECGDDGTTEHIYPHRKMDTVSRRPYQNVPSNLRRIYSELIDCFNNDCQTLCAAGLRALVEGICAQQGIVDGPVEHDTKIVRRNNLEGRIAGLVEKGLLTESSAGTLHEHRYLGNSAVHELACPPSDELKLAIEILEHVMEELYELPEKGAKLRRAIARRKM